MRIDFIKIIRIIRREEINYYLDYFLAEKSLFREILPRRTRV